MDTRLELKLRLEFHGGEKKGGGRRLEEERKKTGRTRSDVRRAEVKGKGKRVNDNTFSVSYSSCSVEPPM